MFHCFLPHHLYILKQMEKPKPCITLIKHSGQTFENVQEISLMFSNARHALSQCNTWLRLLYLLNINTILYYIKARQKAELWWRHY